MFNLITLCNRDGELHEHFEKFEEMPAVDSEESKKFIAYVFWVLEKEENMIYILSLWVDETFRSRGIGTSLLKKVVENAKENKVLEIKLDDVSENFRRKENIYTKLGFQYADEGYPEMRLEIS